MLTFPPYFLSLRAHLAKDSIAKREFYRTVLMKGFHFYVQLLVTGNVQDTQCGFKLFTRAAGRTLFGTMHLYRWAFDTELIYLAEWLGVSIQEVSRSCVECLIAALVNFFPVFPFGTRLL